MPSRNFQAWYKFAFKLLVSQQWHVISEKVEDGDVSYRWLKEQLLVALKEIEKAGWQKSLGGAASNLKDRLIIFKSSILGDEDYTKAQHWLKRLGGKFVLEDESNSERFRIWGAKLALLESTFVSFDESNAAGAGICQVFDKLTEIDSIVEAIFENKNAQIAFEVKVMYDSAIEYAKTMKLPIDDLVELTFEPSCLPTEEPDTYTPPEIWVFGDFGYEDGLLSNPVQVQVDKDGNYLVLDQDIKGEGVVQRIQLFSPKGKFLKIILKRGNGKVNGMDDFCLNKSGNLVVLDSDDQGRARIQVFDYDGNQLMMIDVDKDNPESNASLREIFVDDDDKMICADGGANCIRIFSPEGKVLAKFGEWGRADGNFISLSRVAAHNGQIYAFDNGPDNQKTQVFDYNGQFIKNLWPGVAFTKLVFGPDSQIYSVSYLDHCINKHDLDGSTSKLIGSYGSDLQDFWFPGSMVFLPADGRVAVPEGGNNRVKVFKL